MAPLTPPPPPPSQEILEHIKNQAEMAVRDNDNKQFGLKILSDVDDTLYCSGGKFPAGCDKRLPRRCAYPGVFKFLEVRN